MFARSRSAEPAAALLWVVLSLLAGSLLVTILTYLAAVQ